MANHRFYLKFPRCFNRLASFLICCLLILGLSQPAQSATYTSLFLSLSSKSQLETEVLRIIQSHPEVIIQSVQIYQQQQQQSRKQALQTRLQELMANPQKAIATSPITGSTLPKTVMFEFSDFQCPYCAKAHGIIKQFMKQHGDQIALVYKNYPLNFHPEAEAAAKAAWAADQQGKFWAFHDALFTHQDQLGEDLYLEIAKNLKLDLEKFNHERTSEAVESAITQDIQLANSIGIEGTPFFILNGRTFAGAVPITELEKAL